MESLLVPSQKAGLEVNTKINMCMIMSLQKKRKRNAANYYDILIAIRPVKSMENLKRF